MSNDEVIKKIESELQGKLTPEEHRFLALATRVLKAKENPGRTVSEAKAGAA